MQIPSPNEGKKPQAYRGKQGLYFDRSHEEVVTDYVPVDKRNPTAGIRAETKVVIVPDNPEVIDLETGQSNSKYWKPEKVLDPEGCKHHFILTDASKREVECTKCNIPASFTVPNSYREENGRNFFIFHKKEYEIFSE